MPTERQTIEALSGITVDEIQRAWKFYKNKIYDDGYRSQYNLFDDTKEIFNPVPKIAFIINALTVQKKLEIEITDNESNNNTDNENTQKTKKATIEKIWEQNDFQGMKYLLLLWMILSKKGYIELSRKTDPVTGEKTIVMTLLDRENIEEIKKVGNEIVYVRLKGETEKFNRDTRKFETIVVTKEYYNIDGYNALIESYSGSGSNAGSEEAEEKAADTEGAEVNEEGKLVIPLTWGFIPIVEFDTDYDIAPLFNKIDSYNQIEAYLDNVFYLHGDPLLWDTNTDGELSPSDSEGIAKARFKQQVMLHLGPDAKLQYLEMQGNVAQLMLEKQEKLLEIIKNDYPEYTLADILSKGDPSGDALEIKATEIVTKVESLRGDLESGIVKTDNMALIMLGSTPVDHKLKFADILPKSLKELVDMLKGLREISMLTRKTFMKKVPEIYTDPEQEIKDLKEEDQEIINGIRHDFASDHDANTQN